MKNYYYADVQNNPQGPHSLAELKDLRAAGVITPQTNVIPVGDNTWRKFESVLADEGGAELARAVTKKAAEVGRAVGSYDWEGFVMGVLLVLFRLLALPYLLLRVAANDLCEWGRRKYLPEPDRDLPVLSVAVTLRPSAHLAWTIWGVWIAVYFLFTGRYSVLFPGVFSGMFDIVIVIPFPTRIYYFAGVLASTYFINILIGLAFDWLFILVTAVARLKQIETNTRSRS